MHKIDFNYDLKKDAWSWVLIAKSKSIFGLNWRKQIAQIPEQLLTKIEKATFLGAQKIVEEYIEKGVNKKYKNVVMNCEMFALEKSWHFVEKKYFKILSDITQKPIFTDKFGCYFTTGLVCPYDDKENWFMVSMWHSIPFSITTICHEVMHLQFLHYYKNYLKKNGLTNNQIEDLKESLTVLLNELEFDSIILSDDGGYPQHSKLRKKIAEVWSKNKDFKNLLDEAIIFIKK
ncbi:MAG: hypothetical protein PHW24_00565 [Candidatus Moranbacteria bacterium]|nr:hypothetical protein [Candidatus Moranbacteria bacterium]